MQQQMNINVLVMGPSHGGKSTIRCKIAGVPFEKNHGTAANWIMEGSCEIKLVEYSGLVKDSVIKNFDLILYVVPLTTLLQPNGDMNNEIKRRIGRLQDLKEGIEIFVVYTKDNTAFAKKRFGGLCLPVVMNEIEEDMCVKVFSSDLVNRGAVIKFAHLECGRRAAAERERNMWLDSAIQEMSGAAKRCKCGDATMNKIGDIMWKCIDDIKAIWPYPEEDDSVVLEDELITSAVAQRFKELREKLMELREQKYSDDEDEESMVEDSDDESWESMVEDSDDESWESEEVATTTVVAEPFNARAELWTMIRNSEQFKRLKECGYMRWSDFHIHNDVTSLWDMWYDACWGKLPLGVSRDPQAFRKEMLDEKLRVKMHPQTFKSELRRILYIH